MLRTITLDKIYGGGDVMSLTLDVDSPVLLISALKSQVEGFEQRLIDNPLMSLILYNKADGQYSSVSVDELSFPFSDLIDDIYLKTPTSGSADFGVVEGAVYLTMSEGIGFTAYTFTYAELAMYAVTAYSMASAMLATSPSLNPSGGQAANASFLYSGSQNVIEQGHSVPLVYGTHTVGSIVISAGIDVDDIAYTSVQGNAPVAAPVTDPSVDPYQWGTTELGGGA